MCSSDLELVLHLPSGDGHPAGPNIVAYMDAVTHINNLLMRELWKTRNELAQVRMERAIYQMPPTLSQLQPQAAGLDPVDPSPLPAKTRDGSTAFPTAGSEQAEARDIRRFLRRTRPSSSTAPGAPSCPPGRPAPLSQPRGS